ncbi:EF-hand domain-containing family member B isoform X2 [Hyla sarda]|uniref:EF-hand domain-containing family member B isoform X2 n=1 Tax=Hyla sarda TaxID=327740 RepID=UPI0024C46E9B|nr:EF-hand domain-containing family member B isoform X2 [Hyla sarda]XP_056375930.1 EF-hand domain-containing family member B isoform X2 [Hyla sarda]
MGTKQESQKEQISPRCCRLRKGDKAGKLFPAGDRAASCLVEDYSRPSTPPVVQKFLNSRRPNPGVRTVFYGKANDPRKENYIIHGVSTRPSLSAGSLINVPLKTLFQQKLLEKKESLYSIARRTPLGKSHDQAAAFPTNINFNETTFGQKCPRSLSADVLINPSKSLQEIEEESCKGHDLYVVTHNDYDVGEIRNRKYDWTKYKKDNRFGIETPHFNDGRKVARSLRWLQGFQKNNEATIVSKRVDDFRERSQHQLGKVLDPIADTLNVSSDHTFGILYQPEKYGVGDILHYRAPKDCLRGKERQRAELATVQQQLKKANHHTFTSLLEAFKHYDKNGDGKIDKDDLKKTCKQFGLGLDNDLFDSLIEYCDVDKDGLINFIEFANFLNWKDNMPIGKQASLEGYLKPEDLVLEEGASEKTLRTLSRGHQSPEYYQTSSSRINATIGSPGSSCYRTYGIPTVRTDLAPPRLRRISDRINYGDESDVFGLLCPSIFTEHMVYERDLFKSRPKEEIAQILHNVGINIPDNTFEELWKLAAKRHPRGEVSVESMRNVLHDVQSNTKMYSIA